jgi:hypothetical protein
MAAEKFSISFNGPLAAAVRAAAAQEGLSISSWLAEAAKFNIKQKNLGKALAKYAQEHGRMSNDDADTIIRRARQLSRVTTTPKASRSEDHTENIKTMKKMRGFLMGLDPHIEREDDRL